MALCLHFKQQAITWTNIDFSSVKFCDIHLTAIPVHVPNLAGFEISNWMHLSVGQVGCKNHLSECTIHLSEIYKTNATYVKIRNTQSSVGQVLQVFHLSDCHFYSSQTMGRVKFQTLLSSSATVAYNEKLYF